MYINEGIKKHRGFRLVPVLLLLTIILALPISAAYPKYDNYVGDEADVISEHTERTLRKYNETLKEDLGVSISVGTVKTTDGVDIGEYARALYKEWNLGDGILILVAVDDEDFYFVQSKNIEKLITNEDLAEVRDNFLAEDFDAGNIDRGILKTVTSMSSLLVSELQEAAETEEKTAEEDGEAKGTTVGSVIVGVFVVCLCVVLAAVLAFVGLFIAAMFNEDCAEFMRTKIFRRGQSRTPAYNYDERLYGNQNRSQRRSDPYAQNRQILDQRRSNPNYNPHRTSYGGRLDDEYAGQQNRQSYRGYAQNGYSQQMQQRRPQQNPYTNALPQGQGRTYYNADGTMRQNRPQQNANQRQQNYGQSQGYAQQQNYGQSRNYAQQQNYGQSQGYAQQQNYRQQQGYAQSPNYAQQNRNNPSRQTDPRQTDPRQTDPRQQNTARQQYNKYDDQSDAGATRAFTIPGRDNN